MKEKKGRTEEKLKKMKKKNKKNKINPKKMKEKPTRRKWTRGTKENT